MIIVDSFQSVVSEGTSKGNQLKFYKDGYWIKLDNPRCFEGLAEDFVSKLCSCIIDFPYIAYTTNQFEYNDDIYNGCMSYNMFNDLNVSFVSLRKLLKGNSIPLNIFIKDEDTARNMLNVIDTVGKITNIDISNYLFRILMLDALIINEDRHYMNLGVANKNGRFYESQCFDNGSSLFCTNWTYKKRKTLEENINFAKSVARPFSKFFDNQVEACLRLGAKPLVINKQKLDYLLSNYYNSLYSDEQNKLIKQVLIYRLNYYAGRGVFIYV